MQGKRTDRVAHLIHMELSQLILTRVKDPRLGFVTVTRVEVMPDLKNAHIFYSVMGDDSKKKGSQAALEKAAGFLQREISKVITLRNTPRLKFRLDDSIEHGFEIDKVLRKIKDEETHEEENEE